MLSRVTHLVLVLGLACACSERYSPWEIDLPPEFQNLTQKNLNRLAALPAAQLPIKIAAIGDPQGTPEDLETLVKKLNTRNDLRLMLVLGDLTDYGLQNEYLWAARALEKSKIPYFTVVGNHDAIAHGKKIYQDMFGAFNYTFEDAGLKFVMWNNNQYEFGEQDFSWLESVVDERSIVNSHIPPVKDQHRLEQVALWKDIGKRASILASLHGHRGGKTDFLSEEQGVPYYVAPRVRGVRYSVITIDENRKVSFQLCHDNDCQAEVMP